MIGNFDERSTISDQTLMIGFRWFKSDVGRVISSLIDPQTLSFPSSFSNETFFERQQRCQMKDMNKFLGKIFRIFAAKLTEFVDIVGFRDIAHYLL